MATATIGRRVMKFRVKDGIHVDGNRVWKRGEITASIHDLTTAFKNKFDRVDDSTPAHIGWLREPVDEIPNENAKSNVVAMPIAPPAKPAQIEPAVTETDADDDADETPTGPAGIDKTAQFPKAVEQDCRVFKHERLFFVYDGDDLTTPINATGVKKPAVDGVIESHLKTS